MGNLLGEGKPAQARVAAVLGGGMQVAVCLGIGAVLIAYVETWVAWFALEPEGVALLMQLRPLAVFYWFGARATAPLAALK